MITRKGSFAAVVVATGIVFAQDAIDLAPFLERQELIDMANEKSPPPIRPAAAAVKGMPKQGMNKNLARDKAILSRGEQNRLRAQAPKE